MGGPAPNAPPTSAKLVRHSTPQIPCFFPQRPSPPARFRPSACTASPLHPSPPPSCSPPTGMQPQGPHMMHHPPLFEFDSPLPANYPPHPPNGIVNYGSPSRFSPNLQKHEQETKKPSPPPKDKKESISQEVLDKAMWQLQTISAQRCPEEAH